MRVERLEDAAAFLSASAPIRASHPALTNVLGSVATAVRDGRRYDDQRWWVVVDDAGAVLGAALRTVPWPMLVTPMPPQAAVLLAAEAAGTDPGLSGVVGPAAVVTIMLPALGRDERARIVERVMVLDRLQPPAGVPGCPQPAGPHDLALLVAWHEQFAADAGLPGHDIERSVRWRIDHGAMWWWTVEGEPVSMAGHAEPVDTPAGPVTRLGPVYTPAPLRGRGYAGAVTAVLAARLRDAGSTVMLHADASNRTSVALYRRLGFRTAGTLLDVTLAPSSDR